MNQVLNLQQLQNTSSSLIFNVPLKSYSMASIGLLDTNFTCQYAFDMRFIQKTWECHFVNSNS